MFPGPARIILVLNNEENENDNLNERLDEPRENQQPVANMNRERLFRDRLDPIQVPDEHLLRYYRLPRNVILELCELEHPTRRSHSLSVMLQVLIGLRFLASCGFQSLIGDIAHIFDDILSDEDEDIINIIEAPRQPRNFRVRPSHMECWNDEEFINRFRLSKVSSLLFFRNHALLPLTQLLISLRFYACGSILLVAADFGGVHKSTASRVIKNMSQAIASLAPTHIKMPENNRELAVEKEMFYNISRFPNVIGAIDCTHVQSPGGANAKHFRNRKGYFSLNVQTVSNAKGNICNVVARWPGASHDSTIFNNSRLKAQFEEGRFTDGLLLGDSGYALRKYLMTPLHNPILPEENLYNESHILTRNVVERSYGMWKRRFPILRLGMRLKMETIQTIIVPSHCSIKQYCHRYEGRGT
ncbi:putative nuclease HARBI1 [Anoplophora glabripennis]|uniref:putative nuclease HARBI1 n=1 Tax=Anoplophora glabripennis TaxID=217634 RepID=UPI000C783CF8|nr:putative nuclease HARBI1 [Anoplophora glabripennis]